MYCLFLAYNKILNPLFIRNITMHIQKVADNKLKKEDLKQGGQ